MWWSSSSNLKSTTTLNNNLIWFASDCVCVADIYMFCEFFAAYCWVQLFTAECWVQMSAADCWVQLFSVSICKTSSAHCWQQLCYDAAVLGDMLALLCILFSLGSLQLLLHLYSTHLCPELLLLVITSQKLFYTVYVSRC